MWVWCLGWEDPLEEGMASTFYLLYWFYFVSISALLISNKWFPSCDSNDGEIRFVVRLFQFSCSVMSDSLWSRGLKQARLPCTSPILEACSNYIHPSLKASNHLMLCHHLRLLPSVFPGIRVSSNGSVHCIRWPKYWSFNFRISPSNEYQDWFPLGWAGWISLQSKGLSRVFSNTSVQRHQIFGTQLSL